jgi:hypothetical protein
MWIHISTLEAFENEASSDLDGRLRIRKRFL